MFKKLKEKLAEEVSNARIVVSNSSSLQSLSEMNSPSSNNGSKHFQEIPAVSSTASVDAFSIAEEDPAAVTQSNIEENFQNVDLSEEKSEPATSTFQEYLFLPTYTPTLPHHIIQSDLESASEYEDSTSTWEKISKEQLLHSFMRMQSKYTQCRAKYRDVVKAYKEQMNEKEKIKSILSESQDKALRRIAELKEESLLAKHAKADMEDNFRIMLEEKDELIHVLQTQVKLLKDGVVLEDPNLDPTLASVLDRIKPEQLNINSTSDNEDFIDIGQKPSTPNESISSLETRIKDLTTELETLKSQELEGALIMAENKRQMHKELEQKEQVIVKMKNEIDHLMKIGERVEELNLLIKKSEVKREEEVSALKRELIAAEKALEEEKEALVQELSRGKTAAIALLKEQFEQKTQEIIVEKEKAIANAKKHWENSKRLLVEEFEKKIQELNISKNNEKEHALHLKDEDLRRKLVEMREEMNLALEERDLQKLAALSAQDLKIDEFHHCIMQLKKDKNELKDVLRDLEIQTDENQNKLLKQLSEIQEKHLTEMEHIKGEHKAYSEELHRKIEQLENEMDKSKVLQEQYVDVESKVHTLENFIAEREDQLRLAEISITELRASLEAAELSVAEHISQEVKQQDMWDNERKRFGEEQEKGFKELKNVKRLNELFQAELKKMLAAISDIQQEKSKCKEEIFNFNKQTLQFKNNIDDYLSKMCSIECAKNRKIENLNIDLEKHMKKKTELWQKIENLVYENNCLQQVLSEMKLGNDNMKHVLENLQIAAAQQSQQHIHEIGELRNHILQLENENKNLVNQIQKQEEQLVKLNCDLEQSREALRNEQTQLSLAVSERLAAEESIREAHCLLQEEKSKMWLEKEQLLEKLNNSKNDNCIDELNKMKEELDSHIDEKNTLSALIKKLEKEALNSERELREKGEDLEKAIFKVNSLSKQNELVQKELKTTKQCLKEKDIALAELKNQKDEAMCLLSSTETKLLELNDFIAAKMEMMENRDGLLRQELHSLRTQMNANKESYHENIKKLKKDLEKSSDKLIRTEREQAVLEDQISTMLSELKTKDNDIEELQKARDIESQKCVEEQFALNAKTNEMFNEFILKISQQLGFNCFIDTINTNLAESFDVLFDTLQQKIKEFEAEIQMNKITFEKLKGNFDEKVNDIEKLKTGIRKLMQDSIKPSIQCLHTLIASFIVEVKEQKESFSKYEKEIQNEFNQKLQSLCVTLEDQKREMERKLKLREGQEEELNGLLTENKMQLENSQKENERLNVVLAECFEDANKMKLFFFKNMEASQQQADVLEINIQENDKHLKEVQDLNKDLEKSLEDSRQQLQQTVQHDEDEMKKGLDKYQKDLEGIENQWKQMVQEERLAFQLHLVSLEEEKSNICQDYEKKLALFAAEKNTLLAQCEETKNLNANLKVKLEKITIEYKKVKEKMQNIISKNNELSEKVKLLENTNDTLEVSLHTCKQCIRNLAHLMKSKVNNLRHELNVCKESITENRNSFVSLEKEQVQKVFEISQLLLMQVEYIDYLKAKIMNFETVLKDREINACNLSSDLENLTKELNDKSEKLTQMAVAKQSMQNEIIALKEKVEELEALAERHSTLHAEEIENIEQKHAAHLSLQLNELKKKAEIKLGQIKKQMQGTKEEQMIALLNKQKALEEELKSSKDKYKAEVELQQSEKEAACQILKYQLEAGETKLKDLECLHSKHTEEIILEKNKIIEEISSHCTALENKIINLEKASHPTNSMDNEKKNSCVNSLRPLPMEMKDCEIQCSLDTNISEGKNTKINKDQDVKECYPCMNKRVLENSENMSLVDRNTLQEVKQLNEGKLQTHFDDVVRLKNETNVCSNNSSDSRDEKFDEDAVIKYKQLNAKLTQQNNSLKEELSKLNFNNNKNTISDFTSNYEEKLASVEDEHVQKIKQLVRDFSLQMEKKDEEFEDRISDLIDTERQEKARLLIEHKTLISELQQNLEQNEDSMEKILQTERNDFKKREEKLKSIINDHEEQLNKIQAEHIRELENLDKHWKAVLLKQQQRLTEQHEEEVQGLTEEWKQERMPQNEENIIFEPHSKFMQMKHPVELEKENILTMAAISSGSDTNELLRKQIIALNSQMNNLKQKYQSEVEELRSLVQSVNNNEVIGNASYRYQETAPLGPLLTESTEIEYLRNILFHYMMGRQTLTLAKVIAAVVKFSEEQTKEILEKEETRNSMIMNFLKTS